CIRSGSRNSALFCRVSGLYTGGISRAPIYLSYGGGQPQEGASAICTSRCTPRFSKRQVPACHAPDREHRIGRLVLPFVPSDYGRCGNTIYRRLHFRLRYLSLCALLCSRLPPAQKLSSSFVDSPCPAPLPA